MIERECVSDGGGSLFIERERERVVVVVVVVMLMRLQGFCYVFVIINDN